MTRTKVPVCRKRFSLAERWHDLIGNAQTNRL
jgi:hypothetical protein